MASTAFYIYTRYYTLSHERLTKNVFSLSGTYFPYGLSNAMFIPTIKVGMYKINQPLNLNKLKVNLL